MKRYPKMFGCYGDVPWNEHCISFEKLDGSNLRFEYSRKQGWYKYGTRNLTFDKTNKDFAPAIDLFLNKYGEPLAKILRDKFPKVDSAIAYAEYLGPVSFAGIHDPVYLNQIGYLPEVVPNDPMDIVLFDFNPHKKGFVSPVEFLKLFSHLHIPKVIYEGKLTQDFFNEIRSNKHSLKEGVVCKGNSGHKLWMRKIKTNKYLEEVRRVFGTGWQNYWE